MKSVGKPCEGKLHARFDEGAETKLTVIRIADTGRVNLPENRNPEHGTPKQGSTLPVDALRRN
jgi:hypothetical protein